MTQDTISSDKIKAALARALDSEEFRTQPLRSRFLEFIVAETLQGRSDRIKGTVIAMEVYGRGDDFDPQSDPIVRVEARKVRRDLEHYYLTSGANDDVRIDVPKGGYVPTFAWHDGPSSNLKSPHGVDGLGGSVGSTAAAAIDERQAPNHRGPATAARSRGLISAGIAALVLLAVVVWFQAGGETGTRHASTAATSISGPALFVVPFQAASAGADEASLAKGTTIELVHKLSQFRELKVYPVGAAFSLPEALGQSSGPKESLAYILDGDVQIVGTDLRLTARLQKAGDGLHVWSEQYVLRFAPEEVFKIQQLIAENVAKKLAEPFGLLGKISGREIRSTYNPTLTAYKCVLAGYQYRATFSRDLHGPARACLEQAVKTDPDYSRAWALLAYIYADEYRFFYNLRPNAYRRTVDAGRRAVELDPDDALSFQALSIALFGNGEIEAALQAARKAVELNPNNHVALMQLGYRTYATGNWEDAYALVKEAIAKTLSPPQWYPWVPALYYYRTGQYGKALTNAEAAGLPNFVLFEATRTAIYGQLGLMEKAAASLAKVRQLDPEFDRRARRWFAVQQFPQDFLDQIMDGLVKAGLDNRPPSN